MSASTFLESTWADVKYAVRQLLHAPGFALVCIVTLALGIGANTAIFTLVNAIFLKSLPVAEPQQLYLLNPPGNDCCVYSGLQDRAGWALYSTSLYRHLRDHTPEFESLVAFQTGTPRVGVRRTGSSESEAYVTEAVSGNYFSTFGISAFAGRVLAPADDQPAAAPAVVLSYQAWQTHFHGDASVIGSSLNIAGVAFTVVGVTPPEFYGDRLRPNPPDLWIPLNGEAWMDGPTSLMKTPNLAWLYLMGRLRKGESVAKTEATLTLGLQQWLASPDGQATALDGKKEDIPQMHVVMIPGAGGVGGLRNAFKSGLQLLSVICALILLIACANLANLLLAKRRASMVETCIRLALGASRPRLIRQTLTESVLLSLLGGAAGIAVAYAGAGAILALAFPNTTFIPMSVSPSPTVLAFAIAVSVLTGVIFGVTPAWLAARSDPADALRSAGRSTGSTALLPQRSMVVLQAAMSLVLLAAAGLLTRTLSNLETQQYGFERGGRVIVRVNPGFTGYSNEKLAGVYRALQDRMQQLPGVVSSSYSLYTPMEGNNWGRQIYVQGQTMSPNQQTASWLRIGPHYFETLGTHIVRGRTITEQDTPTSPRVAVVNESFVKRFFKNEDPIGKHFGRATAEHGGDYEIVGVVEDSKYQDARGPAYRMYFVPYLQIVTFKDPADNSGELASNYMGDIELLFSRKPDNLEAQIRHTLSEVDPNITVLRVVTLDEQVSLNFTQERLISRLAALFGALALVLVAVGLYGLTTYSVTQRTREIGIRMAVGAQRVQIFGMILRGVLTNLAIGLAIGIPTVLAGTKLISSQLYGVKTYDPWVLMGAAVLLALCGLPAGLVPARRAASVDPMRALRTE